MKTLVMLFCDKDGQMILEKSVDIHTLGKKMNQAGIAVHAQINENMCSILQAFGDIIYEQRVVRVQQKIEEKKNIAIKKEVDPKFIDVTERLISFKDFTEALKKIGIFDVQLARMGYVKSGKIEHEIKELEASEQNQRNKWI